MTKKKIIIRLIVIIAVVILLIKGKGLLESRKAEVANEALPTMASVTVSVVNLIQGSMQNRESYLAQVGSDKSIKLSTKLAGYVERVFVEESQKVKKGEVLVQIDETELQSNIQAVQATLLAQRNDLALAKSIYTRNVKLFKVGGLAKEKVDISKVAMKAKEAVTQNTVQKIEQLTHQLSYLKIVAPFDGEIDAILLHEGDLAASGKPILSMSNGVKKLVFSYAAHHASIAKDQLVFAEGKFRPLQINIEMQEADRLLISPCPATAVARASEVKLAQLPVYERVEIIGAKDE